MMIIWSVVFLLVEIGQCASFSPIKDERHVAYGAKIFYDRLDSMDDEKRVARSLNFRDRKGSTTSTSTESSVRLAYEKAMNRTIEDYYAQRKAVMERYYARQREIIDKFDGKTTTQSPSNTTTRNGSNDQEIDDDDSATKDQSVEGTTVSSKISNNTNIQKDNTRVKLSDGNERNEGEKNNSNDSWIYRLNKLNSRAFENETDSDVEAASSNVSPRRTQNIAIPGSYRLGEFRNSDDEKIIYQHNLGVGLKGRSQLEAIFEVVLEGEFVITVIEAFPYANTRAHFSWVSGGPGTNNVKLRLKGYENEGFSYTVLVWGVPK